MQRSPAILILLAAVAGTTFALRAPLELVGPLLVASLLVVWKKAHVLMVATGMALYGTILAAVEGIEGLWIGLALAARMAAVFMVNLAILSRAGAVQILDGLRLPGWAVAWPAATLLAARDLADDLRRMHRAAVVDGSWPETRRGRTVAAARLLPSLMVSSARRSQTRREALRLAGHDVGPHFVPIVAVASLAAMGRLALVAVPNVALTYVVVFLGGVIWGPRAGAVGALLAMVLTDLLLSGLAPAAFVNAPAMALIGLAGGLLPRSIVHALAARDADRSRGAVRMAGQVAAVSTAASLGIVLTLLFSVATDTLTWLVIPEARALPGAWQTLIVAGLAFNALPALVNGILFAITVGPTVRAMDAWRTGAPATQAQATP